MKLQSPYNYHLQRGESKDAGYYGRNQQGHCGIGGLESWLVPSRAVRGYARGRWKSWERKAWVGVSGEEARLMEEKEGRESKQAFLQSRVLGSLTWEGNLDKDDSLLYGV